MYIGVFKRFLALFIDSIVFIGLYLPALFIFQILSSIPKENTLLYIIIYKLSFSTIQQNAMYLLHYYVLGAFIWLMFETIFVSSRFSGTPGKVVLEMEIACYNNASIFKVLIRSFIKIIFLFSIFGLIIEAIKISSHHNKQSFHDIAASTLVSYKESKTIIESRNTNLIFDEIENGNLKTYEDIMALKSILSQNKHAIKPNRSPRIAWIIILIMLFSSVLFGFINYINI